MNMLPVPTFTASAGEAPVAVLANTTNFTRTRRDTRGTTTDLVEPRSPNYQSPADPPCYWESLGPGSWTTVLVAVWS